MLSSITRSNRTLLELKCISLKAEAVGKLGSNRTLLELKYEEFQKMSDPLEVPIVPYWN